MDQFTNFNMSPGMNSWYNLCFFFLIHMFMHFYYALHSWLHVVSLHAYCDWSCTLTSRHICFCDTCLMFSMGNQLYYSEFASVLSSLMKYYIIMNRVCHPGGHFWDYYPKVLSLSQVTACNSFEDRAPVDFIYGCPIFKWVAETWPHDRVPGE